MGHNDHGVVAFQLGDELFHLACGDRVQGRARLIEQQHFRLDGHATRDAQALLLATREARAALLEFVFHFGPQGSLAQGPLDTLFHLGGAQVFKQLDTKSDVVVDRHREGRGLLEHHADLGAQAVDVLRGVEDVLPVDQDFAFCLLPGVQGIDTVEGAKQRRLSAPGRTDEGGHLAFGNVHVDVLQRMEAAVIEIEILDPDLCPGRSGYGGF